MHHSITCGPWFDNDVYEVQLVMTIDIAHVTFAGMPAVRLNGKNGDHATVLLRGAQLVSWVNAAGQELLYSCTQNTGLAAHESCQPVRGGVPVVFPQFGDMGPLQRHGFARSNAWVLHDAWYQLGVPNITLRMRSNESTRKLWPHDFDCYLHISLDTPCLAMALEVVNTGTEPMRFNAALHPYLRVENTLTARLMGIPGERAGMSVAGPIDFVHYDLTGPLQLRTGSGKLDIASTGFTDAVVWNPGPDADAMDGPREAANAFVCVEAATVGSMVDLAPGDQWMASQTMRWSPAKAVV